MTTKKITLNELKTLVRQIIKEESENNLVIGGKNVKTFTQNGDTSYAVTFDDGTKRTIYVSNDDWDLVHKMDLKKVGADGYKERMKKFDLVK
jgi:hypothetical protein